MQTHDKKQFAVTLVAMAELFSKELSTEQISLYWKALGDWTIEEFDEAAAHLMKSCQFFPKPYDFQQLRNLSALGPHEAWQKAVMHARGSWRYVDTCGDDRVDAAMGAIGGYRALAMSSESEHQFLSKRFMDAYTGLTETLDTREALPSLRPSKRIGGPVSIKEMGEYLDETYRKPG